MLILLKLYNLSHIFSEQYPHLMMLVLPAHLLETLFVLLLHLFLKFELFLSLLVLTKKPIVDASSLNVIVVNIIRVTSDLLHLILHWMLKLPVYHVFLVLGIMKSR